MAQSTLCPIIIDFGSKLKHKSRSANFGIKIRARRMGTCNSPTRRQLKDFIFQKGASAFLDSRNKRVKCCFQVFLFLFPNNAIFLGAHIFPIDF